MSSSSISFHPSCLPCSKTEVDFFTIPKVQTVIEDTVFNIIHPLSTLGTDDAPLEFYIPGTGDLYLDASSIKLYVKLKIVKDDGSDVDTNSKVYGENYLLGSLFTSVDITMNDVNISTTTYAHRAYLESILNYSEEAKDTILRSGGYFRNHDELREFYKDKKTISLYGRIHSDLVNTDRLIPNNVSMKIRLSRSSNAFVLKTYGGDTNGYKVALLETYLTIRRVRLSASIQMTIEKRLLTETSKFPITRTVCRQYTLNAGLLNKRIDNISLGYIPNRIIMGMVNHASFSGIHKASGLKYEHFNISCVDVLVNGVTAERPHKINYEAGKEDYFQSLWRLHEVISNADGASSVKSEQFVNSLNLYGFNLTNDYSISNSEYVNPIKTGTVAISLEFSKTLPVAVSVIVLLEYESLFEIDKSRNVLMNY